MAAIFPLIEINTSTVFNVSYNTVDSISYCHGPVEKGRTDVGVYTCTHFTISLFCLSTTLSIYPIQYCLCPRSVQLSEMIVWESAL